MPSSTTEAALLEKIETLSFLRELNDRLADTDTYPAACTALVELLRSERRCDVAAYFTVEPGAERVRLEAATPTRAMGEHRLDLPIAAEPFRSIVASEDPTVLAGPLPPDWPGEPGPRSGVVWIGTALRVRGVPTGLLCVRTTADATRIAEETRLLAIVATSAALALDVARSSAREEFVAMLRHDISNPLTTALGYTEILFERAAEEDGIDAALAPTLSTIREQLRAISELVANYLHMAAIDRGTPVLRWETVDLERMVQDVLAAAHLAAHDKGLVLSADVRWPSVRADRRQIGRVLANLVTNAIKYSAGPGRVQVTVERRDDTVEISVRDTGFGLSPEDQARAFTKYARFHTGRGIPGTGLGLYLCKGIVEAHGGTIGLESTVGVGSTFRVSLPLDERP